MLYNFYPGSETMLELDMSEQYSAFECAKAKRLTRNDFKRAMVASWALRSASKHAVNKKNLNLEGVPYQA